MAKSFKAPVVVGPDYKSDKELTRLVQDARDHFLNMQNSWWNFAKVISRIKQTEAFKSVADTFKDYCSSEFPTMNYETLTKFCQIVESFQDQIDGRIEKDKEYKLPAYESCYRLTTIKEDSIPKEEVSKLKKKVLDGEMTYASLRERIKELSARIKERHIKEIDEKADKVEEQLLKDLKSDEDFYDEDEETYELEEEEEVDEDVEQTLPGKSEIPLNVLDSRLSFLLDNLPVITKNISKVEITDEIVKFATKLEDFHSVIEKFLTALEQQGEDDE